MCGIAGFVNSGQVPADRALIERMTTTLAHRGPDGFGYHVDGPVALGHRRLSIIDVEGGFQPMSNENGSAWITYNGELYNDPALRSHLLARGHTYATHCDTESLVHLYEEDGPEFAAKLNGMFAFAIWDGPRKRLVLGRDRMGQKPLFYCHTASGGLVFGSEPKALLQHPDVPRRLCPLGLSRYLFYEYIPGPDSIWEGVRKLPPGHILVWEDGQIDVRRYWTPPVSRTDWPQTFEEAAETFWTDFRASVERHRRSDVPLGVFLSGGVDSSNVAAALAEVEPAAGIRTYSIGFEDPTFDESAHALAVAKHLGTDHRTRTFSAEDVWALLPHVADWLDEPFGDASVLPTHLLSRFAREEVTVALGGDGADELMAGYPTFEAERLARTFVKFPRPARALAGAVINRLPVNHGNISLDFKLKQFLRGADLPRPLAHQRWLGSFSGPEIAELLVSPPAGFDVEAAHLARAAGLPVMPEDLENSLRLYQDTYLPDDILNKVDRASMACSLEVRAPFLDAELVGSIQSMPGVFKYGGGVTKRLLKQAASKRLPASILKRPKKGFGIPVAKWLRGPLAPLLDSMLATDRLRTQGLFRPEVVARLIGEHRAGVRDHRKPLWTLLMFQLWYDRWLGP